MGGNGHWLFQFETKPFGSERIDRAWDADRIGSVGADGFGRSTFDARFRRFKNSELKQGAIGFDWVTVGVGGVPWLISRPRKKLIKQHLPKSRLLSPPN